MQHIAQTTSSVCWKIGAAGDVPSLQQLRECTEAHVEDDYILHKPRAKHWLGTAPETVKMLDGTSVPPVDRVE